MQTIFCPEGNSGDEWECKCNAILKQKQKTGRTNLHQYLLKQHQASVEKVPANQKVLIDTEFGIVNRKAVNIFSWLDWICNDLKPFSSVESEKPRTYTKLNPISRNTLTKYLHLISRKIEQKIVDTS